MAVVTNGTKAKTFVGARALIKVGGQVIGIFDNVSYSSNISAEAIHILGKYAPDEIAVTAAEAVTIDCSGFRVIDHGVYNEPHMPTLGDLLNLEGVTIAITDRQDSTKNILTVLNCVAIRHSGSYQAKATSKISISYMGTAMQEEGGDNGDAGASTLTS